MTSLPHGNERIPHFLHLNLLKGLRVRFLLLWLMPLERASHLLLFFFALDSNWQKTKKKFASSPFPGSPSLIFLSFPQLRCLFVFSRISTSVVFWRYPWSGLCVEASMSTLGALKNERGVVTPSGFLLCSHFVSPHLLFFVRNG